MKPLLETIDTQQGLIASMPFSGNTLPAVPFRMNYFVPQTSDQERAVSITSAHLSGDSLAHSPVLGWGTGSSLTPVTQANWVEQPPSPDLPMMRMRPLSSLIIWRFSPYAIRLKPSLLKHYSASIRLGKSKTKPSPLSSQQMVRTSNKRTLALRQRR